MVSVIVKISSRAALVLMLAFTVSACGKRGSLEAPPGQVVGVDENGKDIVEKAPEKPDRPFILDPLL